MKLEANHIAIGYGNATPVFQGINFKANEGDMIALLGVNGIGKSTLLRTLSGLQPAVSGTVKIGGKLIGDLSAGEKATLVSMVLTEKISIEHITVRNLISLGRSPYTGWFGKLSDEDENVIAEVIELLHLRQMEKKYFSQLSDGEKQKVLIARALCQQTPVVILDEPTAFLDFRNKKEIMEILRRVSETLQKIILLSTHDIEAAIQYCNKCWVMTEDKTFTEVVRAADYKSKVEGVLSVK